MKKLYSMYNISHVIYVHIRTSIHMHAQYACIQMHAHAYLTYTYIIDIYIIYIYTIYIFILYITCLYYIICMPIAHRPSPIAYRLYSRLPIVYCLLPTAYHLLPIAYSNEQYMPTAYMSNTLENVFKKIDSHAVLPFKRQIRKIDSKNRFCPFRCRGVIKNVTTLATNRFSHLYFRVSIFAYL